MFGFVTVFAGCILESSLFPMATCAFAGKNKIKATTAVMFLIFLILIVLLNLQCFVGIEG